ncbi:MAG: ABC transporter ATP-binding protein, partial [Spirochaetia bacterium]|nr:ABC transporter ATP-binding protein [Spirochaetia bacterium]
MTASASPWKTLLPVLRPWRWHLTAGVVINAAHGIGMTFQIFIGTWLIDWVLKADVVEAQKWIRVFFLAVAWLVASIFARMLTWHVGYRILTWVRERMLLDLRARFFHHVNHLCLRFHMRRSSGELFSYLFGSPLGKVMEFYQHVSMNLPGSAINLISTLVVVSFWNLHITAVLAALVFGSVFIMNRARKNVRKLHSEFQNAESAVTGEVAELLRGNKAIKLYAMEQKVDDNFHAQADRIGRKSYERDVKSHMLVMTQEGFGYAAYAVLMVLCTWAYLRNKITLGQVTGYLVAYNSLQGPMQSLFTSFTLWGGSQASLERIGKVLAESSSTPDPDAHRAVPEPPSRGTLRFEHVSFSYDAGQPVLKDVSLEIRPGEKIALVGPSGSGKSTIVQLFLRLYDPDEGRVMLENADLRTFAGASIRRRFGVVPQDPFLFRTTIRENIKVARENADDVEVRRACERAQAWEFISRLPGGLDEMVGEGGSSLSGGQKQRLAIARALLTEAPF